MSTDREATVKRAEKLLRQGKLDGAIQEYVRLVETHPRDWNAMNALGDLYARAGDAQRAVAQFTRVADHLYDEGFLPRAAAVYKKALKTLGDHEPSLLRLGELAVRQGLGADARLYLNQVARLRHARGDGRGAHECLISLGGLPDPDSKVAAGRAAAAIGDAAKAADLLLDAAQGFEKDDRAEQALEALVAAAEADHADLALRARAARRCLAAGQAERARPFVSPETAGDDPELLLILARIELGAGRQDEGRLAISRLMMGAPDRASEVVRICDDLAAAGKQDAAFACVEAVSEMALLGGDLDTAIGALQSFLRHGPHVPALVRLVDIAVDSGRDDLVTGAQERLADVYLEAGRGAEARTIAEDLVARDPGRGENVERLRRALIQTGAADVESIVARHLEMSAPEDVIDQAAPLAQEDVELDDDITVHQVPVAHGPALDPSTEEPPASLAGSVASDQQTAEDPERHTAPAYSEPVEVDLSDAVAELAGVPPAFTAGPATPLEGGDEPPHAPAAGADLETVFQQMRSRVRAHRGTAPAALLDRGMKLLQEGRVVEAIADLEAAARAPMLRFAAASTLGHLHASRDELPAAVDWLERAAEAPATSDADSLSVLYALADVLERMGETARALAVLLEIDADRASYRDVPARIEQLTRAQAGSADR